MTKTDSKYQILVESQIIRRNHEWFPLLDDLAFKAKNVRNATVYAMRQYTVEFRTNSQQKLIHHSFS